MAPGRDRERERHPDDARQLGHDLTGRVAGVEFAAANPGRFGRAFFFSEPSSVDVDAPGAVFLKPSTLTLLAWVRASQSPGAYRYIAAEGARACIASQYALYTGASGGLAFYIDDGQTEYISPDAGQGIWDGNWHAVAGTFDGQAVRLYVDGAQIGTGTPAATTIGYPAEALSTDFQIGYYPGGGSCPHPGSQARSTRCASTRGP